MKADQEKEGARFATAAAVSRQGLRNRADRAGDSEAGVTLGCARHRARGPRSPRAFVLEQVLSRQGHQ